VPAVDVIMSKAVKNHPFWREFVRDVEDIWPVAEVMFR
jgi:hypothetical protein